MIALTLDNMSRAELLSIHSHLEASIIARDGTEEQIREWREDLSRVEHYLLKLENPAL